MKKNGRKSDELRQIRFTRSFTEAPTGSVLVEFGKTKILCTVIAEDGVPPFLLNTGKGWVTAEYSMLPGSSPQRKPRDSRRGSVDGRSLEIGRLIGRSLRAVTRLDYLGPRTFWVDCDVLQADGGTRTAAITGSYIARHDARTRLKERNLFPKGWPLRTSVAAVSAGLVKGKVCLDLDYNQDSRADADMNIVMTGRGEFVEIQGSAERGTFSEDQLGKILSLAGNSIREITRLQREALGLPPDDA